MRFNSKKPSLLAICKNYKYHPNLEILLKELKNYDIEKISLPLSNFRKLFWIIPWLILYPKYKFKLTEAYIYTKSKLKNSKYIIGYSVIPERIQELSKKYKLIKTIQLQSGYLGKELSNLQKDKLVKLKNIDFFWGMSEYQCKLAKKYFAKKVKIVGLLSSEDWIKNNYITCNINGFKYDLCMVINSKICISIKYSLKLILNYFNKHKGTKLIIALKFNTDFKYLIDYCKNYLKIDITKQKNIYFTTLKENRYSTLNAAKESKIIVGVRSTALYQLGSLGMIIYPINIENKHNGNLINLNLGIKPSQKEFNLNVDKLLKDKYRIDFISKNLSSLKELDNTLQLVNNPSLNIKKELDQILVDY